MAPAPELPPAMGRPRSLVLLAPLAALAVLWSLLLPAMGRLPANDYYGIVGQVVDGERFTGNPLRWLLVKSNEHTAALPTLVYAANVALSGGNNLVLSGFALLLLLAGGMVLTRLLPASLRTSRTAELGWGLVLAGLVFTPAAAHSIVLGFSGTIWFLANLLAVVAVLRLSACAAEPSAPAFAGLLAAGLLGTLAYSTNLALWPALLLGAVLLGLSARRLAVLAGGGFLACAFAALTYARPVHHTAPTVADPVAVAKFFAVYLGAPLARTQQQAGALGVAGLLLAAVFAWVLLTRRTREDRRILAPWLALQLYAAGNALGTAVARVGMGGARSSRYASVAILFWLGLAAVGAHLAARAGERTRRTGPGLALAAGLTVVVATWACGLPVLRTYLERAARQPLAELALVHGVADRDALAAVTPAPEEIARLRPFLTARRHVPFDRPAAATYGQVLAIRPVVADPPPIDPASIRLTPIDGAALRIEVAPAPALAAAGDILLVGAGGITRGVLRHDTRRWLPGFLRTGPSVRRWAGYVAPATVDERLLACVAAPGGDLVPVAVLVAEWPTRS